MEIDQLEKAIKCLIPGTPEECVFIAGLYDQLADLYFEKWTATEKDEDFELSKTKSSSAIEYGQQGAETAPLADPQKGSFWALVAERSNRKFARFGDSKDLDDSITFYDNALQSLQQKSRLYPAALLNQANSLCTRFENHTALSSDSKDIDLAISKGELAIRHFEACGLDTAAPNSDVSTMYLTKFERTGSADDLKKAANLAKRAVDQTATNSPGIAIRKLNWANCLRTQFECSGNREDLEMAISELDAASKISESLGSAYRAQILSNLAHALYLRYEAAKTGSDLVDAINKVMAAMDAVTEEDEASVTPVILSNLAAFLYAYSQESKELDDLNNAIETSRLALTGLQNNESRRAMCLNNLSNMLRERFENYTKASPRDSNSDLEEAIQMATESAAIGGIEKLEKAKYNDSFSRLLQLRFELSGHRDEDALAEAISRAHQAVSEADIYQVDRADYLIQLGDVLGLKYGITPNEVDFENASSAYKTCLEMRSASPLSRITAGHRNGLLYQNSKRWVDASESLEGAVRLMPELVCDAIDPDNQQRVLSELTSLAILASSIALQAGRKPAIAFNILETGRGVIAELAIRNKEEITGLQGEDEEGRRLSVRYEELRQKVSRPLSTGWLNAGYPTATYNYISQRLSDIEELEQIRKRLGFKDSHLALSEAKLKVIARKGYIVSFVVSTIRSDAIIIMEDGVHNLPLPRLRWDDLTRYYKFVTAKDKLRNLDFNTFFDINEEMKQLLLWLWDVAVLPVLQRLGVYSPKSSSLSQPIVRIYWLTTGVVGLMPLHAAGHHEPGSAENTLSHVISSYATNTKSLSRALMQEQERCWHDSGQLVKALVVGMPETPEPWSDFDNIGEHVDAVKRLTSDVTFLERPSSSAVMKALSGATVAHFVCHGISSSSDPSNGSLLLYDKEANSIDPLTVRTIGQQPLLKARLAFLAACQTADNAAIQLMDETIHIASSFQIVGYPHVIGTLWEAEARASAVMAEKFYESLAHGLKSGGDVADCNAVSLAWQDAMLSVRAQDPDDVVIWAPFVHFGA